MSYTNLIDSQLRRAFNLVKDLATVAVFKRVTSANFDFNAAETQITTATPTTTKIVIFDGAKQPKGASRIVKNILVKAKEVGDVSAYDTVTFDGKDWSVINTIKGTGFIFVLEIAREAPNG